MKKIIGFILGIGNFFLSPFVAMLMWNWFATELGAPEIGYWLSFGLIVLTDFVTYRHPDKKVDVFDSAIVGLGFILIMWLIAFIIHGVIV